MRSGVPFSTLAVSFGVPAVVAGLVCLVLVAGEPGSPSPTAPGSATVAAQRPGKGDTAADLPAPAAVPLSLTPLPEGSGLAAGYVRDEGIAGHAAVLFVDGFEGYASGRISWSDLGGWDNVYGDLVITRTAANVHNGSQAVQVTCSGTQQQAHGTVKEVPGQDVIFVRWYMKYHAQFPGVHHSGASVRGGPAGALFDNPTGTVPNGTNHFTVMYDHLSTLHSWNPEENDTPPGWGYDYCYHMDQSSQWGDVLLSSGDLNGNYPFSNEFTARPNVTPQRDHWTCFEVMVKSNTLGQADGRVGLWMDGQLIADHPGLRFRTVAELKSRYITPVAVYASEVRPNQTVWYDDVVIAKQYIGPMADSANHPPEVSDASPETPHTMTAGTSQAFQVWATDPDGDPLSYAWKLDAEFVGTNSPVYSYGPAVTGNHTIAVSVSDGRGGTTSHSWAVTVTDDAPPPDPDGGGGGGGGGCSLSAASGPAGALGFLLPWAAMALAWLLGRRRRGN